MANLNTIKRPSSLKRFSKRVGRGQSSGKGKQAGRGTKGQNARSGRKKRPEMRDIIKRLPKRRGYGKNRGRTVDPTLPDSVALSLTRLDKLFDAGAEINPAMLRAKGLIGRTMPPVKIVGGETSKKFAFKNVGVSASARSVIEKAGGSVA